VTTMVGWQVVVRSTILWAACWPLLVAILWNVSGRLTGYVRVAPGIQGLLGMWLVFAPGAAVVGALGGCLLLWASRRVQSQAALHRRGLAWGTGLGLLVGLLGVLLLVTLLPGEGTKWSWWELVLALLMVPGERPMILGEYAAVALSGALLGRIVAGWAAQAHWPREP
jgi:hypothetical protein